MVAVRSLSAPSQATVTRPAAPGMSSSRELPGGKAVPGLVNRWYKPLRAIHSVMNWTHDR